MSLLDDARELTARLGRTDDGLCRQCGRRDDGQQEHREDCPMPRAEVFMPRIVAALEAAEAMLWALDEDELVSRSLRQAADDLEIAMDDGTDDDALVAGLVNRADEGEIVETGTTITINHHNYDGYQIK